MMAMTYFASVIAIIFALRLCGCSYADQDEDLMQTLTQLEHFTNVIKQEMIGLRINVEEKLRKFKPKEFDWLQNYFRLKKMLPTKEDVLKEAQTKVGDLIQNLKNENRDIRLKVHKYVIVHGSRDNTEEAYRDGYRKSNDVSFRSNDPLKTKLDGGENIILTNTPENNGNGYNNYAGVFIAPVTGTYYFVLQLCNGGNYVDLSIRRDEGIFSWARFFPYYLSCQTVDMLIPLERGDQVYPSKTSSWDYDIMNDNNELYNSFIGVLLA